ncbi:hypothetical protein AB0G73_18395 [Streptomyces sp. NPDC020719]|uniref:hypothetical protein n=1 Tax=Streptomyces sp. NPDC020719 TaxID=3154896 RepID=UPI0033CC3E1C
MGLSAFHRSLRPSRRCASTAGTSRTLIVVITVLKMVWPVSTAWSSRAVWAAMKSAVTAWLHPHLTATQSALKPAP